MRNCTRDEGRSFEAGSQVLASNRCKLLSSKAMVVNNVGRISRRVRLREASASEPPIAALLQCWQAIDRSGAYDSDADHWLCFCDSLGTGAMPGSPGQSRLSLVLRTFNRRQGPGPFRVLACTQRAVP